MHGLLADNDLRRAIVRGILRRMPVPFATAVEVGMEAMADDDLLAWAAARDYVVVSQDRSTKEASAFARMGDALTMTGLVLVHSDLAIGRAVDDLVFLIETATDADWRGRIHHLPL